MLGLSLGGSGVLGYAGDVAQASRAGSLGRNFDFVAEAPARALATARQAIVGVRNARFGRLTVSFAPLPSGRIAMNIDGVGRVVAPHWESLTRLRLRMNTTAREFVQERAAKIGAGEAGLVALRGGVSGLASARELVYQVGAHMGLSQRMTDRLISGITLGAPGQTSAFNRARNLRVAADIGLARWLIRLGRRQPMSQYNEFIAMNEIFHELVHAQRLQQWLRAGKTEARYWLDMPQGSSAYAAEEVIVETAAQNWTKRIVEPRIAQELQYGSASNGRYLQQMLDEMIEDSNLYIDHYRTLSRQ